MPDNISLPSNPLELKLSFTGELPGQPIVVEIVKGMNLRRETMSQANRDREDGLWLDFVEQWQKFWHNIGVF